MRETVNIRLLVKLYHSVSSVDEPGTVRKATIEENGYARLMTQPWVVVAPRDYEIYIRDEMFDSLLTGQ